MNIIVGVIIITTSLILMAKRIDSKVVLLSAGIIMAVFAGDTLAGFNGFSAGLTQTAILEPIITSMGFAAVMKLTGCDQHLIQALLRLLKSNKAKSVLLPATMTVTMVVNLALNSATATAASIGAIMIPVLIASGYHPAVAAAAIISSTYGSALNPGHSSNALVAKISQATPMAVVSNQIIAVALTFIIQVAVLMFLSHLQKDNQYVDGSRESMDGNTQETFRVSYMRALCLFVPLIILVLETLFDSMRSLSVGHAMIIGCIAGILVTRTCPKKVMTDFWKGAGHGFATTFSIIVCANVFVTGMTRIGLIDAMNHLFINNPSLVKISAIIGPAFMTMITGTGTGMAVAFNEAVSSNAAMFGLMPINMGSLVTMTSVLARAVSPVAAVVILTAGIAGCSPVTAIKKQVPGFILSLLACAVIFL